jgi:hypothetical protein
MRLAKRIAAFGVVPVPYFEIVLLVNCFSCLVVCELARGMFFKEYPAFVVSMLDVTIITPDIQLPRTNRYDVNGLYMGVICVSADCERGKDLWAAWGERFVTESKNSVFRFVTALKDGDFWSPLHIKVRIPANESNSLRHIFYMNLESVQHFVSTTSLPWYVRTTYDCFCYLPNLWKWIAKLNEKYDPYREIVFKGQSIMSKDEFLFVHGGSGWLLSRRAAQRMIEVEDKLKQMYKNRYFGDDVAIRDFLQLMNISWSQADSTVFQGSAINPIDYEAIVAANMSIARAISLSCPAPEHLMHGIYQLNKLVFMHNGLTRDWAMEIGEQLIRTAPDNIYVEPLYEDSRICINSYEYVYSMPGDLI